MESAVKSGARINDLDANKRTALNSIARLPVFLPGVAETIWWLLDHGADPNLKDEEGLPLHLFVAANKGSHQPDVKLLAEATLMRILRVGAKVSGTDSDGRTPLHIAAKYDNVRAAEILIREGAKVMPRDNIGKTPLDYAESAPMIGLLKQNGATER